jgi:tetratricopeptide (TPR) repeat protein
MPEVSLLDEAQLRKAAWSLLDTGKLPEAADAYLRLYEASQDPKYLRARGVINLRLRRLADALHDFRTYVDRRERRFLSDDDFIYLGICHWYLDQSVEAVTAWKAGLDAPYTDAAGGVEAAAILIYASMRVSEPALEKLGFAILRKISRRSTSAWPAAIAPYLLGKIKDHDLDLQARMSTSAIVVQRQQCQADFYVALAAQRRGDDVAYNARLRECARSPFGYLEHEYYLALWELGDQSSSDG